MNPTRTLSFLAVLSISCGSCGNAGPEADKNIVRKKLAAIEAAAQKEAGDKRSPANDPVEGLSLDFSRGEGFNAAWVLQEHAVDLSKKLPHKIRFQRESKDLVLLAAKVVLKRPGAAVTTKEVMVNKKLLRLQKARYVLLVNVESYNPAIIVGSEVSPGHLKGKASLYELAGTRFVGGFPFKTTIDGKINFKSADAKSKMRNLLSYHFANALKSGITSTFPGAKLQEITGYTSY